MQGRRFGRAILLPRNSEIDKQNRIIELLEEMVKWTRVTSIPHVKKLLSEILQTDEHKIVYHHSDGERTREVIGGLVNVSGPTVSNWWKKWIRTGIAELLDVQGGTRGKSLFQLEDFDIQIPVLTTEERSNPNTSQETQQE
jgi:hypothetical protein